VFIGAHLEGIQLVGITVTKDNGDTVNISMVVLGKEFGIQYKKTKEKK